MSGTKFSFAVGQKCTSLLFSSSSSSTSSSSSMKHVVSISQYNTHLKRQKYTASSFKLKQVMNRRTQSPRIPSCPPCATSVRRNLSQKHKPNNNNNNYNNNYKQTISAFTIGTLAGACGSLAG